MIQPLILGGFIIKSDMLLSTDRIHMEGKEWQQKEPEGGGDQSPHVKTGKWKVRKGFEGPVSRR